MIKAGALRHVVEAQRMQRVRNPATQDLEPAWVSLGNRRAEIIPIIAGEKEEAEQIAPGEAYKVRMRYWPELKADDRLIQHRPDRDPLILNIDAVIDVGERRREMVLRCKSGGAASELGTVQA